MKCLRRLGAFVGVRRWRTPSLEARAARASAESSLEQAMCDLEGQTEKREEADVLTASLKAHNSANRYSEWLREVVIRP